MGSRWTDASLLTDFRPIGRMKMRLGRQDNILAESANPGSFFRHLKAWRGQPGPGIFAQSVEHPRRRPGKRYEPLSESFLCDLGLDSARLVI